MLDIIATIIIIAIIKPVFYILEAIYNAVFKNK